MFDLPRASGLLLHPTSLPGRFGIGEIGPEAHRWLQVLADSGQRVWQMLPLGPTGHGNSPYQSLSSFAGNPMLISFDGLRNDGALLPQDLAMLPAFPTTRVDFGAALEVRSAFLQLAARRFLDQCGQSPLLARALEMFCDREAAWLDDFAMFTALKEENHHRPWVEWPDAIARRRPQAMAEAMIRLEPQIEEAKVLQFFFHRQWQKLRVRARELGIRLVGDIPIFTAHDSADVWAHPELFQLDDCGHPTVVAGVPPDFFSASGQRWGNPLYRWQVHQDEGFAWWIARVRKVLDTVDIVRIDHFRGFAACWEIPADEPTAIHGRWVKAPGDALFTALKEALGEVPVIAEDLGLITGDVTRLRDRFGFPGMRVLPFAFGGAELNAEHIPDNYPSHSVAYTGTHDNDTALGFFMAPSGADSMATPEQITALQRQLLAFTGGDAKTIHWDFLRAVFESPADLAVAPVQDVLGLDSSARMNIPGQSGDFWSWRFTWDQITPEIQQALLGLSVQAGRAGTPPD